MTMGLAAVRSLGFAAFLAGLGLALTSPAAFAPAQAQDLPSVADLADRLLPAVVEINVESQQTSASAPVPMPDLPENSPFKDFFDDFFKRQQQGQPPRTMTSLGSGFIIDSSGVIVTNNHVIDGATAIEIRLQDASVLKAELVGRDPKTDIAVLRVKPSTPLPAVAFGDSDHTRVGEWVMAIGNPFGLGGSVSLGIVSARNRDINAGPYDDYIQTDAAINKGNSGGPLFNLKGEVIGINTAIFSPSGGSVGIGFSVPANTAKGVVAQLIKFGETRRGWLGVKIQTVTDDIAESIGLADARGALIADVTKPGPAAKAGIEPGDVIVEFDGRPILQMRDLPRIVAETEVGKETTVKVLRKGKEQIFKVEVGRLEDGEKLADASGGAGSAPATVHVLGMTLVSLTEDLRAKYKTDPTVNGAVVTDVAADSAAADKKLVPGDVITEAAEKEVKGAADVQARVDEASTAGKNSILLLVAKGGKASDMRFIAVKLKK